MHVNFDWKHENYLDSVFVAILFSLFAFLLIFFLCVSIFSTFICISFCLFLLLLLFLLWGGAGVRIIIFFWILSFFTLCCILYHSQDKLPLNEILPKTNWPVQFPCIFHFVKRNTLRRKYVMLICIACKKTKKTSPFTDQAHSDWKREEDVQTKPKHFEK